MKKEWEGLSYEWKRYLVQQSIFIKPKYFVIIFHFFNSNFKDDYTEVYKILETYILCYHPPYYLCQKILQGKCNVIFMP